MSFFHPSRSRLDRWYHTGEVDEGLEQHVEACVKCSDEIERIAVDQVDVTSALTAVLEPEPGLEARMGSRIGEALLAKQDLQLMWQVLSSGVNTAKILLDQPHPDTGR
ncbi:MAG: hypothetical protein GY708_24790 [Actinomycetia bacterium]|nr:hypothetical protein [Actinomycetes bacterium]MCP4959600.1 hypothetical protein [Actinomycetes bacterium]